MIFEKWQHIILGAVIGALAMYSFGPRITNTVEKPVITEKIVTETQIKYVPKETVVYKDPETGVVSKRELDGKFTFNKPDFIFTVNGKPGKFTRADDEQYVFQKNMMQLTQGSVITLKLNVPTTDKTKNNSVGIGTGSNGLAIMATQKNSWEYFDKKTKAGGFLWRY